MICLTFVEEWTDILTRLIDLGVILSYYLITNRNTLRNQVVNYVTMRLGDNYEEKIFCQFVS